MSVDQPGSPERAAALNANGLQRPLRGMEYRHGGKHQPGNDNSFFAVSVHSGPLLGVKREAIEPVAQVFDVVQAGCIGIRHDERLYQRNALPVQHFQSPSELVVFLAPSPRARKVTRPLTPSTHFCVRGHLNRLPKPPVVANPARHQTLVGERA